MALHRVSTGSAVRLGTLLSAAAVLAACSAPSPGPAPETTAPDPTTAALSAYTEFFRVSQDANADPAAKDWAAELRQLARGQALDAALLDVQNFASLSARVEGRLGQSPAVDPTAMSSAERVAVLDCLDATDVRVLKADGTELGDSANQAPRYRYRAEVVRDGDRWWVEKTTPSPDETC